MERRDQASQQKEGGDLDREHIGADQRNADRLGADHRARRRARCHQVTASEPSSIASSKARIEGPIQV